MKPTPMSTLILRLMLTVLVLAVPAALVAQTENPCPLHAEHMKAAAQDLERHAALDQRGDQVMGFEHQRTTHHFLLEKDGGAIQVEANDPADAQSREQIRGHLTQIAQAFARGDFAMPGAIHDRVLPGIPEMTRLKDAISYRYEETGNGARVRITTADPAALEAVHAFLRAQIEDHRTGDPAVPAP
jgi:hypothetical protein